ncbi:MAG: hypothetical protein QM756_42340 [Polyangiaceae bacterium]
MNDRPTGVVGPNAEADADEGAEPESSRAAASQPDEDRPPAKKGSGAGEFKDLIAGRAPHTFLLLLIALLFSLTVRGLKQDSPTEDEWAHLVRGIGYFQTRDMRAHVQHPPLANVLDALPSARDQNPDVTQMKTWSEGYVPGLEYISVDYGHARQQLARGRYVAVLFLVGLAVYVFYFCLSVFGWKTAAAATFLVAFSPTLMGQARYVATDMPVATFAVIATGELVRYLTNSRRIYTLGLALAGLVLSKHSGIVLLGMIVLLGLLAALMKRGIFSGEASLLRRLGRFFGHFAIAGAIVIFSINAIYKFDRTFMSVGQILSAPEPQHWVTKRYNGEMLEQRTPLPKLPSGLRIPLPYSYLFGLFAVQEQNRGGYPTYFMGKQSRDANPAYFPVLLLTKSTPALLGMLLLGGVMFWRTRKGRVDDLRSPAKPAQTFLFGLSIASSCFLAMSLLFLLFLVRSNLNMGVRHGIAVMALASVLGGRAFALAHEWLTGNWLRAAQYLAFSGPLSALVTLPNYLNYYNVLALGRGDWINVVGDDWGQDRQRFVQFVKEKGLEPLYYNTQTPTRKLEVDHLGLQYKELSCKTNPPPGAWAAIHSQYVHRFEDTPKCAPWMHGLEPKYKFNDNVWVYKIPEKQ